MQRACQYSPIPDPDTDCVSWIEYWADFYLWKAELLNELVEFLQDLSDDSVRTPSQQLSDLGAVCDYLNDVTSIDQDCVYGTSLADLLLSSDERDEAVAAAARMDKFELHRVIRRFELTVAENAADEWCRTASVERRSDVCRKAAHATNRKKKAESPKTVACQLFDELRSQGIGYGEALSHVAAAVDRAPRQIQRYLKEQIDDKR